MNEYKILLKRIEDNKLDEGYKKVGEEFQYKEIGVTQNINYTIGLGDIIAKLTDQSNTLNLTFPLGKTLELKFTD